MPSLRLLVCLLATMAIEANAQVSVAAPPIPPPSAPDPPAAAAEPALSPPKVRRTIDDIMLELVLVPVVPTSIEAKAQDVARVVARSARKEAELILGRLIPEALLAESETADPRSLEPVRQVVALLLKKVALDKDDNRAALAIGSLGEWAKSRKHGAAAKLALEQLAEDRMISSRPKRLRALERVQARLEISNVGE
jgi:hypothetical protein